MTHSLVQSERTTMNDLAMLLDAVSFAAQHHVDQVRKDGVTPYIAHPVRVMLILRHVFLMEDPHVLAAAVLHDTIEDTTVDRDDLIARFGERVGQYVALLSKDKRLPEAEREQSYLQALSTAPIEVKLCKLADAYDNLADVKALSPTQRRKSLKNAQQLVEMFSAELSGDWPHALDAVNACIASMLEAQ